MTASLPTGIGAGKAVIGPGKASSGAGAGGHRALPGQRAAGATVPHLRLVPQPEGMLQIHTAPYRGSFATVLSQALRTAGLGSRVLVSQFLKGGVDQGLAASPWLCGRLRWLRPAVPACLAEPAEEHSGEVREAVAEVWQHSRQVLLDAAVDLLVLDELGLAMELGYVGREEVLDVLERRPAQMDVILTGPAMGPELMAMADQVTQLRRGL
jgi:cob(I)alamin adenosyltransferase